MMMNEHCRTCGNPREPHNFRHPFVGENDDMPDLNPKKPEEEAKPKIPLYAQAMASAQQRLVMTLLQKGLIDIVDFTFITTGRIDDRSNQRGPESPVDRSSTEGSSERGGGSDPTDRAAMLDSFAERLRNPNSRIPDFFSGHPAGTVSGINLGTADEAGSG